ncbi:MAG: protein translocase subunit SecD [Planctomycetota bacterium]
MLKRFIVIATVFLVALFLQFLQNKVLVGDQDLLAHVSRSSDAAAPGPVVYDVTFKDVAGSPVEASEQEIVQIRKRLHGDQRNPAIKVNDNDVSYNPSTRTIRVIAPAEVAEIELGQRLSGRPFKRANEPRDYWYVPKGIDLRGGVEFTCMLKNEDGGKVDANDEIMVTLRNRLDEKGLTEPKVARLSNGDVQIVIPGGTRADAARTRKVLETTGRLEFREVLGEYPNSDFSSTKAGEPDCAWIKSGSNSYKMNSRLQKSTRTDIIAPKEDRDALPGQEPKKFLHLGPAQLTGKDVSDAHEDMSQGELAVAISFTTVGSSKNYQLTNSTKEKGDSGHGTGRIAIIFDGIIKSDPRVISPSSSSCQITGRFTSEEIKDLRGILKAGSLSVTPEILSERVVGATLGQAEINRAFTTMLWTLATLFVFLAAYYRRLGLVAIASVLVNGALTWTTLAVFGATLTLPGIAGLILSLAMGIDTNILIYERIREELLEDKGVPAAIEAGYAKAFRTVLDSHLTTITAAFALYIIGSGPIKGFGLTLMIGIALSLFSGIYVGRMLTDFLLRGKDHISMASLFKPLHVGYVRLRYLSYALTIILGVVGIGYFAFGHRLHEGQTFERNFDIEFTGGTMVQVSFTKPVTGEEVTELLTKAYAAVPKEQQEHALINPNDVQRQAYFTSLAEQSTSSRQWVFRVRDVAGSVLERERHDLEEQRGKVQVKIAELREKQKESPNPQEIRRIETEEYTPLQEKIKKLSDDIAARTEVFKQELAKAFTGLVAAEGDEVLACTWDKATLKLTMRVATFDPASELQTAEIANRMAKYRNVTCRVDGKALALSLNLAEAPTAPAAGAIDEHDHVFKRAMGLLAPTVTDPAEARAVAVSASAIFGELVNHAANQRVAVAQSYPASQHFSGQVADRMKIQALVALGVAMLLMMFYIAARFEMAFGLGAVVSLLQVVIQTLGIVALFGIRIDLTIVAAFLTIVGYAINDTIVTFDRIRENLGKMAGQPLESIIDRSIAEIMPRTILTGGHVALVLVIMIYFGGDSLHGFCSTLLIGILLGTFSSVFVASPLLLSFRKRMVVTPAPVPDSAGAADRA